ncbi:hypothetical protein ANCDUO_11477 [Ancylostoma duodenale]|uniref:Peptidase S9A N-terminal domain-containing protein n=1 Tax=Ancylostoma duodenale TaxID=51022 RepID=A0A0C2GMR5_9BILA|nr:hypothetical protein ANCDUO_11477 [Ancylostoma duodenale]
MSSTPILILLTIVGCPHAAEISHTLSTPIGSEAPPSFSISPAIYPTARRNESIIDDFHGTKVADPYRWMEDPNAPETCQFVRELNAISEPFLAKAPNREDIRKNAIYRQEFLKHGEKGEVFLDSNDLAGDGTATIRYVGKRDLKWSPDGSILAYGVSKKGSDWLTLKVSASRHFLAIFTAPYPE